MRFHTFRTVTLAAVGMAGALGMATGCENKTEGDRTLDHAAKIEDAGLRIKRGEAMIVDGKATEARGQAMKDQGKTVEGDKTISEGQALRRQGEALVDQGRQDKQ